MLRLQRQGRVGTYLQAGGNEATALGSACALRPTDWLVLMWREWPAYLWRGWPLERLILLYAGFTEGTCVPEGHRELPVYVPMGSHVPHAVGIAYSARYRREDSVTLCYFGDGASSQAATQEALNFAGVYELPLVFVCVNNQWAISMPCARQTRAATLAHKAVAYGFPGVQVDGNDLLAVFVATRDAVARARAGGGPTLIEAVTYRLGPHSTADDPTRYRSEAEVQAWAAREPLVRFRRYLEAEGLLDDRLHGEWDLAAEAEVRDAVTRAEATMAGASLDDIFEHVYAEPTAELEAQRRALGGRPDGAGP
jgi:pyruvate dehydrogenase E1 component alpha subunit